MFKVAMISLAAMLATSSMAHAGTNISFYVQNVSEGAQHVDIKGVDFQGRRVQIHISLFTKNAKLNDKMARRCSQLAQTALLMGKKAHLAVNDQSSSIEEGATLRLASIDGSKSDVSCNIYSYEGR